MSKVSLTSLMVLCAALAACSDADTNRTVTAPDVRPALSEAPADVGFGVTPDGPFDVFFATEDASAQQAAAQMAAAHQPATGSRASGHVGFNFGVPTLGLLSERYSFVALSTDPATPFAAKGQYSFTIITVAGVVQEFTGDVICMGITGNKARMAGQLTSVVVNGIPRQINPDQSHNIWTVADNGEGQQGTPDQVSPMIFFNAALAPLHCASDFIPPQFNNEEGNVQVQP